MKQIYSIFLLSSVALMLASCGGSSKQDSVVIDPVVTPLPDFALVKNLGDQATAIDASNSGHGFSTPIANLTSDELAQHLTGDALFESQFTTAPNNEHPEFDGLGPVFNNQDCNSCHQRDGRASTPEIPSGLTQVELGADAGIFLRISLEDGECNLPNQANNYCKNTPVPDFGTQLFHRGVLKARSDWQQQAFIGQAKVYLSYQTSEFTYPDGATVTLQKPIFSLSHPFDADELTASQLGQPDVRFSPRNGMPVFGLGLLELIPEQQILALADETDSDNNGISGKPNWVYDIVKANQGADFPVSLGRFGWKASTPSVRIQSLGALRGDMGITNPLFPDESIVGTSMHDSYLTRTNYQDTGTDEQGDTEASEQIADDMVFYAETLAVPARRNVENEQVKLGAKLFAQVQCTSCHHPDFTTSTDENAQLGGKPAPEALKGQHIYPFTDMLLHDMGQGLADNRRDFTANGREWKTRPLWGIGLTKTVNPAANFLHDGRAQTLEQAILWHGGEAEQSKQAFAQLTKTERESLIAFLNSL